MKQLLFLSFLMCGTFGFAQNKTYSIQSPPVALDSPLPFPNSIDTTRYYSYREIGKAVQPVDGWAAFYKGMYSLPYPKEAKEKNQQCSITVDLRLNERGDLDSIYLKYYANYGPWKKCPSCEELIFDYIKSFKWQAGEIHGVPVKSEELIFVEFRIDDPK